MKLIEKMARKYLAPHFLNETEGYALNEEEIFMAGFRAARAIVANKLRWRGYGRAERADLAHTMSLDVRNEIDDAIASCLHAQANDVEEIGEEEIE